MNSQELWSFDPFEVFKKVFGTTLLIPDLTTQNGGRILTTHVDGDAFFGNADFDPSKTTGEVIRDEIIKKISHSAYRFHNREVSKDGLYPDKSERLINIAKSIFSLEWVEPASHSFSHPYDWQPKYRKRDLPYGYNLPIKGYNLNWDSEIRGSVEWINREVLKDIGEKVRVFLWTGECNPNQRTAKANLPAWHF